MNYVPIVVATDLEVHFSVLKKGATQYFWQYSVYEAPGVRHPKIITIHGNKDTMRRGNKDQIGSSKQQRYNYETII